MPPPPRPPPPKNRAEKEHGVVTRGFSRAHGGVETRRGYSRPRRDTAGRQEPSRPHGGASKEADEAESAIQGLNLNELEKKLEDEAERAIQQLNRLCLGEEISHDQYLTYLERLPCPSAYVDTSAELNDTQLLDLEIRLALHRLKYAKGQDNNKWKRNCHPYFLERNLSALSGKVTASC